MREQLALLPRTARSACGREVDVSKWPEDKAVALIEVEGEPDKLDRQHMVIRWWRGETPMGQVSFTVLDEVQHAMKRAGFKVEVRNA